ncbi:MAG TPA: hypothetical protein VM283_09775, partial [Armatimonadota bacterium]|nr:hypothetical protein [Armatimonadota bacterium]
SGYDATGLCRLHRRGVRVETALNMSIVPDPKYAMPVEPAARRVALGVGWPVGEGWRYLSELRREDDYDVSVEVSEQGRRVRVAVRYSGASGHVGPDGRVIETCTLSERGLHYAAQVPGADRVRLQVPVIETDGATRSRVRMLAGGVLVSYAGHQYRVTLDGPPLATFIEDWPAPNRNGIYRVVVLEASGSCIGCEATLT